MLNSLEQKRNIDAINECKKCCKSIFWGQELPDSLRAEIILHKYDDIIKHDHRSRIKLIEYNVTESLIMIFLDYYSSKSINNFTTAFQNFSFDNEKGILTIKGSHPVKGDYTFKTWLDKGV